MKGTIPSLCFFLSFFMNLFHFCSQTALFNVLKAYSIFDPELGYCQGPFLIVLHSLVILLSFSTLLFWLHLITLGMNFIAGILVCNMNQEVPFFLYLFDYFPDIVTNSRKKRKNDGNHSYIITQDSPVLTNLIVTIIFS